MIGDVDPLILTVGFDAAGFERLNALRIAHFPPSLNRIPAHLTLFHHLPGERFDEVRAAVAAAAHATEASPVVFTGLRKLGRGVALEAKAPGLGAARDRIAAKFADVLTPQDRQGFRPHVTVQNKVDPKAAAELHERLSQTFSPWTARAEALLLWRYRGGPWEAAGRFAFKPSA